MKRTPKKKPIHDLTTYRRPPIATPVADDFAAFAEGANMTYTEATRHLLCGVVRGGETARQAGERIRSELAKGKRDD